MEVCLAAEETIEKIPFFSEFFYEQQSKQDKKTWLLFLSQKKKF